MRQLILFWNNYRHIAVDSRLAGKSFVGKEGPLPDISFFRFGKGLKIGFPLADNESTGGTAALATTSVHPVDAIALKMVQQRLGVIRDLDGRFGKVLP